jgi:uncharacterized protein (TIGR02268 family)
VTLDGEGTRIRRVDVGDKSVIVEPLVELGQERALLRVRFMDGAAPAEATLAFVSDPAQVDSHVRVSRRAHSAEELEKKLAEVRARCEAREVELAELRARCEANGLVGYRRNGALFDGAGWCKEVEKGRWRVTRGLALAKVSRRLERARGLPVGATAFDLRTAVRLLEQAASRASER